MRAMTVEYHAPARFDDLLEIFVRVDRSARRASRTTSPRTVPATDALMATAKQTLVLISLPERKPVAVPDSFRDQVAAFEG